MVGVIARTLVCAYVCVCVYVCVDSVCRERVYVHACVHVCVCVSPECEPIGRYVPRGGGR